MLAFFSTLSLRVKILAVSVASALLAIGYLYVRWKIASAAAKSEEAKRKSLEAARKTEINLKESRAKLKAKEVKWRDEILARTERDHFESGWGP